jgi:hypothetical protein
MAVAFVQYSNGGTTGNAQNPTCVMGANVTPGSLLIAFIDWGDAVNSLLSVTDTFGNVYTPALPLVQLAGYAASAAIYWAKNTGSGANTVTANFNTAVHGPDVTVYEVSGYTNPGVDVYSYGSGGSGDATSGNITTTTPNEFVIGGCVPAATVGTGTAGWTTNGTINANSTEWIVLTSTGTVAAAYTGTSGKWLGLAVAFKEVAAGTTQKISITI